MKKIILLVSIFCFFFHGNAQKASLSTDVSDIEEVSCDETKKIVSEVTNTGKSLLVIASGYDCSICRNEAPALGQFAKDNEDSIVVWGAMHNRFSNNAPNCTALNNWRTSYGWQNIYMFNDVNQSVIKYWAEGYTWYTVVSPENIVVYSGGNQSTALSLAKSETKVTGINDQLLKESDYFNFSNNTFTFLQEVQEIELFDVSGRKVYFDDKVSTQLTISLSEGLYIIHITTKNGVLSSKVLVQ